MIRKLAWIIAVLLLLVSAGLFVFWNTQEPSPSDTIGPVVGGDKDEHGCIGSAGYSWCAPMQKCLRIWEENCFTGVAQEMQYLLAAKYEQSPDEVVITITKQQPEHVAGGVKFSKDPGGPGGQFLAVKIDNVWQIVYDGNGSIDCEKLRTDYKFPSEILAPNFCD